MKLLSRLPETEELKREKIYVIFLFLGLVLVAFVFGRKFMSFSSF